MSRKYTEAESSLARKRNTGGLTEQQKRFCQLYVKSLNGQDSYMKVYHVKNKAVAAANASRLLGSANIGLYIDKLNKNIEETLGISRLKVVSEHAKIAFSSIASMHNTWIDRKELESLSEEEKACIQEISTKTAKIYGEESEVGEMVFVKIKLYDKQKSLESISKIMGYDAPSKVDLQITPPVINFSDEPEPEQEI